jgi:hypothetical protein
MDPQAKLKPGYRECQYEKCKKPFKPVRDHQKYCCDTHKVYAWYLRKAKADADKDIAARIERLEKIVEGGNKKI